MVSFSFHRFESTWAINHCSPSRSPAPMGVGISCERDAYQSRHHAPAFSTKKGARGTRGALEVQVCDISRSLSLTAYTKKNVNVLSANREDKIYANCAPFLCSLSFPPIFQHLFDFRAPTGPIITPSAIFVCSRAHSPTHPLFSGCSKIDTYKISSSADLERASSRTRERRARQ